MKCILGLLVLTLVPLTSAAQQTETDDCSGVNASSPRAEIIRCLHESEAKLAASTEKLAKAAADAKKAADDAAKMRSADKGTQIDGVTDSVKDMNSHANNNPASKEVTNESLSLIDQFAQRGNELLNKTADTVRSIAEPQGASTSSFNAGEQHQLVEPQPSLQQQFENRKQVLASTPSFKAVMPEAESTSNVSGQQQSDLGGQFESRKQKLLASPAIVNSVSQAVRAVQAEEQDRLALVATKVAEQQRADKADQDKAEAQRIADLQNISTRKQIDDADDDADDKAERHAEWLKWAVEVSAQQDAWNAMVLPPPSDVPNVPSNDTPSLPSNFPGALPSTPSGGSGGQYFCDRNPTNLFCGNDSAKTQNGAAPAPAQSSPAQSPPSTAPSTTAK
jgi:hypothetical protein